MVGGLFEGDPVRAFKGAAAFLVLVPGAALLCYLMAKLLPRAGARPLSPEEPFAQAGRELVTGKRDPGAWAKALVEGEGDHLRVEAAYVRERVRALSGRS